jgi:hypothetical protein
LFQRKHEWFIATRHDLISLFKKGLWSMFARECRDLGGRVPWSRLQVLVIATFPVAGS